MAQSLKKLTGFAGVEGPVLTIVMDGVGLAPNTVSNAVATAYTPTLDMLMQNYPMVSLKAHGTAVGLPSDDDMGNSEVGHNALGAGQVFAQGAKLVSQSIESGKMFASDTWTHLGDLLCILLCPAYPCNRPLCSANGLHTALFTAICYSYGTGRFDQLFHPGKLEFTGHSWLCRRLAVLRPRLYCHRLYGADGIPEVSAAGDHQSADESGIGFCGHFRMAFSAGKTLRYGICGLFAGIPCGSNCSTSGKKDKKEG